LWVAVVVGQHFQLAQGFNFQFNIFCRPKLLFLRMKNGPVALSGAKKTFEYWLHRQGADLFSAKQRQKKPSRTPTFSFHADSSADRKAKINVAYNV
jgi:hypothetical protein